jgi:signal transduction histidine kinase/PAS domain-containing protein
MIESQKNSTYKKLILLIGIFLVGFISLFTLNKFFDSLMSKLDKKTTNLESKIIIGEFVAYDLVEIRSLFHELATTTSTKRSRENIIKKINHLIGVINESLDVLEKGGTLNRFVALNIEGHLNTTRTVHYSVESKDQLSLETIDIRPKLIEISAMILEADKLLEKRESFKKSKDTKNFLKSAKKLRRYYKILPAYFARISENIRRLLYEGELELKQIRKKTVADKDKYLKIKLYLIISVISIVVVLGYIITKRVNKDSVDIYNLNIDLKQNLEIQAKQEKSIRAILDAQPNIIIVSDGTKMIDANERLLEFFNKYNTFEEFKVHHECICDFFEPNIGEEDYIDKKEYSDGKWSEHMLNNPHLNFKIIMKKNGIKNHFSIQVNKKILSDTTGESVVIVTLNNITEEINSQIKLKSLNDNLGLIVANKTKELQELNENLEQKVIIESNKVREKDKQMIQQARFAALGEMIGNIAHQWRQPLSAINTTASGMQLQMELGLNTQEEIEKSYSDIMGYVDFLTQTIEDFRGFFKEDKETSNFNILDTISKSLSITSATFKDNEVEIIKDFANYKELISHGMPSELSQVFLNILNNAKDATVSNSPEIRNVHIRCEQTTKDNIIYIQDNAGGIPNNIIEKIFDPYFTTKHQAQGTGIGLYMSKDIVEKHMLGSISVKNTITTLNNVSYNGACFKISLPIKKIDTA